MRLKVLTTALFVFGILLLASWPWIVGPKPTGRREVAAWVVRSGTYFLVTTATFMGAGVAAIFLSRRTRQQFRDEATANMRELIEGTLADHKARKEPEEK